MGKRDSLEVNRLKAEGEKLFTSTFSLQPKFLLNIFASALPNFSIPVLFYAQSFERNVDNGGAVMVMRGGNKLK